MSHETADRPTGIPARRRPWFRARFCDVTDEVRAARRDAVAAVALALGAAAGPAVAAFSGTLGCAVSRQFAGDAADWAARSGRSCGRSDAVLLGWPALGWVLTCLCLGLLFRRAVTRVYARRARAVARWAGVGAWCALVAALGMAALPAVVPGPVVAGPVVAALALLAWVAVLPGVLWSPFVAATMLARGAMAGSCDEVRAAMAFDDPAPCPSAEPGAGGGQVWARNYWVPPTTLAVGGTGVCLSGGGIRAGTVAMGALQSFAEQGLLCRVDHLATVSGGGYLGGAHQMLRARSRLPGAPVRVTRADAFAAGSPEEDHVRRHGKYIADGFVQWVAALGVVVRNVLLGLAVVLAALVVGSGVLGWLYAQARPWSLGLFPTADCVDGTGVDGTGTASCAWEWPTYPAGTWLAAGGTLGLAFVAWLVSGRLCGSAASTPPDAAPGTLLLDGEREGGAFTARIVWQKLAGGLLALGLAVLVVGVGVPALSRAATALAAGHRSTSPAIGSVIGLVTSAVTVWNMLSRKIAGQRASGRPVLARLRSGAGFAVRALTCAAVVLGLLAVGLVIVGAVVARTVVDVLFDGRAAASTVHLFRWVVPVDLLWWVGAVVLLVVLAAFFDQTRMSLHPFYKRRLATAFNLRRTADGAEEVRWGDPSTLSGLGAPDPDEPGHRMALILCAAANLSGQDIVPPGRRVTPFVFTADHVGGPRLGYVATTDLEKLVASRTYRSDVTVLAAMAMSGAAVASAMGRMSGPFDLLLALSNARLGVWVPNPRHLLRWYREPGTLSPPLDRFRSPLPAVRRLPYYARELMGNYSPDDRFVYVSDGGHYDNLGLLELLRRRCRTVYCVDASGDGSVALTLAEAATLAYEELGVVLVVDGVPLAPSPAEDGTAAHPQLAELKGRLAARSVVTGTIHYPDVAGYDEVGTLVVGKAVLTADLPFPVLAHATADPRFPDDSTADQWFAADQFDAYAALGRTIGVAMVGAGHAGTAGAGAAGAGVADTGVAGAGAVGVGVAGVEAAGVGAAGARPPRRRRPRRARPVVAGHARPGVPDPR